MEGPARRLQLLSALVGFLFVVPSATAEEPRVTLAVLGDPVFVTALDRELGGRLQDAGFNLVDSRGLLQTVAPLAVSEIVPRFAGEADLLVGVEIVRLGERELRYLGREEWLFSARLDVQAFLLPTGNALADSWSEEIEYTEATAAIKAERCCTGLIPELSDSLRTAWDAHLEDLAAKAAAARAEAARAEAARAEAARAEAAKAAAAEATLRARSKASERNESTAKPPAAVIDPLQAYDAGDYARAAELWNDACAGGETIACYNLGLLYLDGAGEVSEDARGAAELFQKACDGGEAAGCFNLGAMYAEGDGIPRDPHQSAALFRRACAGGAGTACFNLGLLYFTGSNVLPHDLHKAAELFRQACDGGYAPGCFNLGTLYANGEGGLERDENQAAELFHRACGGGESLGCSHLELLCEGGNRKACEILEID